MTEIITVGLDLLPDRLFFRPSAFLSTEIVDRTGFRSHLSGDEDVPATKDTCMIATASPGAPTTRTLVTLLLDRSGSMQSLKADTIGAINAYRGKLRASGENIRYSQVHFDCNYGGKMELEKVLVAEKIAGVPDMTDNDYHPRGGTPLIDAACTTIRAVAASLREAGKFEGTKVVIAIQTDGDENQSVENSWADLKALIAEKEKEGWEFVFMGAGIDAYAQGAKMGISADKTVSYGTDREATRAAFEATAMNTAAFASGAMADMGYTPAQKLRAGDNHS